MKHLSTLFLASLLVINAVPAIKGTMNDKTATLKQLREIAAQFVTERDWDQFHNPKSLSMNLAIEAAELMELFLWVTNAASFDALEKQRLDVEDELADVLLSMLVFANASKIDIAAVFEKKMEKIRKKYPIEKAKGRNVKYTKL